jgi:hypothetical protein
LRGGKLLLSNIEEDRIYHVYNPVGGGSREFSDEEPAAELGNGW